MPRFVTSAWRGLAVLAALGLAISPAAAAEPAPAPTPTTTAPPAEGDGKPLQGKDAFSMDKLESGLWTPAKKKAEVAKSKSRAVRISKLNELINDPTYPSDRKADAHFRLAETHWKEAKFEHFLEMEKYEAAYQCFEEKRCTQEPELPKPDYSLAIEAYRNVLRADKDYKRRDQVTYFLGRAAVDAGKQEKNRTLEKEGEANLKDVVEKYPKSKYVAPSHLTLAEYYFDKDSLYFAKINYEKIIQNFPDHGMYNYALYKLGWVYFNLAEFDKTIDTFHKVIASIPSDKGDTGLIEFRAQALNDLVQTYAQVDNGWQRARDYFLKQVGEADTYVKLDKMAGLLVSLDRDDDAIDLYKHLIKHDQVSIKAVEYYDAVMEVRRKIGDMGDTEREINEITAFFDKKGRWQIANKADTEQVARADELVSTNLSFMANYWHREAQKKEQKRRDAKAEFDNAAKYYAQFLDRFPDHADSYKLNFFYAEILFDELQQYMKAAEQYEKVLAKDKKGEYVEDAALGVVFAMESELDRLGIREKTGSEVTVTRQTQLEAKVSRQKQEEIQRTDLHSLEDRMIKAADVYVSVLSDALKDPDFVKKYPKRGKKIPNMMFIAAQIFYNHGHFKEAVTRLQVIFDLFPKHKMANYAVGLIIDAYKRLKRWEEIEYWARELIKKKNFLVLKKDELEKIIAIAKTEHATDLTRQRRFDEAIRVQQDIVEEFGRKNAEVASKALFNVGAIHEIARRWPEAVAAYEDVIKRYKNKEVAVDALSAIGLIYESQTQFRKAAEAFVQMQQFKKTFNKKGKEDVAERAALAYRDAGVLYEALEEYDKAHDVYTSYYTKLYPKRDDVKTVAFQSALVLEYKATPEAYTEAGKRFDKVARKFGRKDRQYLLRSYGAAGLAFKNADKVKNRRKVEGFFKKALREWEKLDRKAADGSVKIAPATKGYAARAAFELAEYKYDDYSKVKIDAVNNRDEFDMRVLKNTLTKKAEALRDAEKAFDAVLEFKDKGMAAAAAFRLGQILYEFAESLFNAPVPPVLQGEQIDEYRFALEEFATPIQERALAAFTAALKQAVKDGVYNKWSRMSAVYAAKVNKDEFPLAEFTVQPDKTRDTLQSTSFIKAVRRGSTVVDYLRRTQTKKGDEAGADDEAGAEKADDAAAEKKTEDK